MHSLGILSLMSDVRVKATFKVGKEDYSQKNENKVLSPAQLRACLVKERVWNFITPNRLKARKELFTKSGIEKLQLKALKKEATFENKVILSTKI